jgi:uncharacterized damage-inducible protein DinB
MNTGARDGDDMDVLSLRRREFATTLNVLQAYPEDKAGLRPADKSRTAAELATTLAVEERVISALLAGVAASPQLWNIERPSTMPAIIAMWQEAVAANDAIIEKLSREEMQKTVNFYGMIIPLADAVFIELLDHIHHRGQFSVYLRLAGAKVPSIYGPTADVPWPIAGSSAGT